jgi:hypothetical protein
MAFKIKDLMINIASIDEAEARGKTGGHGFGCRTGCNTKTSERFTFTTIFTTPTIIGGCHVCTLPTPRVCFGEGGSWDTPEDALKGLAQMKAELQTALEQVDQEIASVEKGLTPSTVEEAEALESKLKDALNELGKIKSDLKKKK